MEDQSHPTIISQINDDLNKSLRRVPGPPEGPEGKPEPLDRPDEHAQWDEVNGRWIEWDATTSTWVADGIATSTATEQPADQPAEQSAEPGTDQPAEPEAGLH